MNFLIKLWNKDNWIKSNPNWTDEENRKWKRWIKIMLIFFIVFTIILGICFLKIPSWSEAAIRFWSGL
jgi:hypothetical protein